MTKKETKNNKKYDKVSKYILDEFSSDIVEFFTGIKADKITILDKELNLPSKYVDSAYKINDEFILNIEIQTKYDENLPFRMALYSLVLKDRYKLPVKSYVIYLTPDKKEKITDHYSEEFEGCMAYYKYDLIRLWDYNPREVIKKNLLGVFPLVPLMKKDEKLLKICNDKIVQSILKDNVKKDLLGSLESFAGLLYKKEVIRNMLSYEKMKDSVTVQAWVSEGEKKLLLKMLNKKFKKVPKEIIEAINSIEESDAIEAIGEKIFEFKTLDDLRKLLPQK
jgi:hypothetical protein